MTCAVRRLEGLVFFRTHLSICRYVGRRRRRKETNTSPEDWTNEGETYLSIHFGEFFLVDITGNRGGSGLAVVGPPSGRPSNNILDNIVQKATHQSEEPPGDFGETDGQNVEIVLYRNGFVVNDGPLRDLTSPQNQEFLASLERGEVPRGKILLKRSNRTC